VKCARTDVSIPVGALPHDRVRIFWWRQGRVWCNCGCMSAHADKSAGASPTTNESVPKPYLKPDGTLVIPMSSETKYHYWKQGGQSVNKTVEELKAAMARGG